MPTYQVKPEKKAPDVVPKAQLVRIKTESTKLVPMIVATVSDIVIADKDDYAEADGDLLKITEAEKKITLKFRGTPKVPGPITTIRSGLDQLYALERELMRPLAEAREIIKRKMADYKLEERRQIRELEDAQAAETARLRRQAEEAEQKAAQAKSAPARERFEAKAAELLEQADAVTEESELPVKVVGSNDRFVVKVRVNDLKLLAKGIACGLIPEDVILPAQTILNKYLKDDAETVALWADYGVEVYDDAIIVRK